MCENVMYLTHSKQFSNLSVDGHFTPSKNTCVVTQPEMTCLFFCPITSQKLTTRRSFEFPDIGGQYSLILTVNLSRKISFMKAQLRIKNRRVTLITIS